MSNAPTYMPLIRRHQASGRATPPKDDESDESSAGAYAPANTPAATPFDDGFTTAKVWMLRLLGLVYCVAFLGARWQNIALLGADGLAPAVRYVDHLKAQNAGGSALDGFLQHPMIWWWVPPTDANMETLHLAGALLGAAVALGLCSGAAMLVLWLLYFSVVTMAEGSSFYQYGWESQLLETGVIAAFLCGPSRRRPPSFAILLLMRWLCFRISIGAGLIKIRGGSCWEAHTCLHYHFETQPIPSPTSFVFHFLPKPLLSRAVDLDLFVQLYSSWLVLVPGGHVSLRALRRLGGFLQAGFMMNIMLSGNYGFLNHLTVVPALACLDDACWPKWMRVAPDTTPRRTHWAWGAPRALANLVLLGAVAWLSWPVVANLLQLGGRHQAMNASFGAFRLVNTYGAFGSVGHERYEPIVALSHDGKVWHEVDFPCKPGDLHRRPCLCAPYHYRLDWNIWFLGFKPHGQMLRQREGWLVPFVAKLLRADGGALSLLAAGAADGPAFRSSPDGKARAPTYAKVDMYHYEMAAPLWEIVGAYWRGERPAWWRRTYEEPLVPVVRLDEGGELVRAGP